MVAEELEPIDRVRFEDTMAALHLAQNTQGMLYLTDEMKTAIVDGVTECSSAIAVKAYYYFGTHEFEPTTQIIPIMRYVVECALAKGVLQ